MEALKPLRSLLSWISLRGPVSSCCIYRTVWVACSGCVCTPSPRVIPATSGYLLLVVFHRADCQCARCRFVVDASVAGDRQRASIFTKKIATGLFRLRERERVHAFLYVYAGRERQPGSRLISMHSLQRRSWRAGKRVPAKQAAISKQADADT